MEQQLSSLNLVIAAAEGNRVIMVDASANNVLQQDFMKAFKFGVKEAQKVITALKSLQKLVGKPKREPLPVKVYQPRNSTKPAVRWLIDWLIIRSIDACLLDWLIDVLITSVDRFVRCCFAFLQDVAVPHEITSTDPPEPVELTSPETVKATVCELATEKSPPFSAI